MEGSSFDIAMHVMTAILPPILLEWWLGGWRRDLQARAKGEVYSGDTERLRFRTVTRLSIAFAAALAVVWIAPFNVGVASAAALSASAAALTWLAAYAILR